MVDRFEELRTYVAIVEAGGVNAAAARIGIARSAVSRRLSELEVRLGTTLVERSTRRFELTDTGRALFDDSRRVLDDLAALDSRFSGGPVAGERITVALDPDIAGLVAPALAQFRASRDGMTIVVVATDSDAPTEADVRVSAVEGAAGRRVAELQRVVVCSPGYLEGRDAPATPDELERHTAITVDHAPSQWTFRRGATVRPPTAFAVPDAETALTLAIAGAGVAQLPRHLCADAIERGALTVLLASHEPKPVPVSAESAPASPLAAALVDALVKRRP